MSRRYPDRPFVGVGAAIVRDGRVVLVKRRFPPLQGAWSLPGGAVEVGETLHACVVREMREETGLDVRVGPVLEVFDRITHDADGRVEFHYVLIDYLCWPVGGALAPGSDVADAVLADVDDLTPYALAVEARRVIARAMALASSPGSS